MDERYELVTEQDEMDEPTTAEIVAGLAVDVELFFAQIDGDDALDDDTKADLTRIFEDISESLGEAKKLIGVLPDSA